MEECIPPFLNKFNIFWPPGAGSTPLHYAACGGNAHCCQVCFFSYYYYYFIHYCWTYLIFGIIIDLNCKGSQSDCGKCKWVCILSTLTLTALAATFFSCDFTYTILQTTAFIFKMLEHFKVSLYLQILDAFVLLGTFSILGSSACQDDKQMKCSISAYVVNQH